jgi:predicted phosphodiesterase
MKIFLITDIHFGSSSNTQPILKKFVKKSAEMIEESDLMVSCGDWISHKQQ